MDRTSSASRQVYAGWSDGFIYLATYFRGLADSWRGWSGTRVFESIEGDLRLDATHDGHVHIVVVIRETNELAGWRVQAELSLDPGEQLTQIAHELGVLVAPEQGWVK